MIWAGIKSFFGASLWELEVACGCIVLIIVGGLYADTLLLKANLARAQSAYSQKVAEAAAETAATSEKYRIEEQRRTAAQKEASDEAQRLAARARAADLMARDAGQRLLSRAAVVAAQCAAPASYPGAAASSPAAPGAGLLAGVLRSLVDEGQRYAAIADEARIAGQACERAYDALTPPDAVGKILPN